MLAAEPPGSRFSLHPLEGLDIKVRIQDGLGTPPPYEGDEDVVPIRGEYDQVWLNDVWVGNRSGAIQAYTQLVGNRFPTVEWD